MDTRCSPNIPHRKFFECLTYVKFTFWMFYCKGHITNKSFTLEGQAWHYPSLQKAIMGFKSKAWMSWWGGKKGEENTHFAQGFYFNVIASEDFFTLQLCQNYVIICVMSCTNDMYPIHPCDVKNEPLFNLSWLKGVGDLASLGPSNL